MKKSTLQELSFFCDHFEKIAICALEREFYEISIEKIALK